MNQIEMNPHDDLTTMNTDEKEIIGEELENQKAILDEWEEELSTPLPLTEYLDHL